jgi:hypothetical protein
LTHQSAFVDRLKQLVFFRSAFCNMDNAGNFDDYAVHNEALEPVGASFFF